MKKWVWFYVHGFYGISKCNMHVYTKGVLVLVELLIYYHFRPFLSSPSLPLSSPSLSPLQSRGSSVAGVVGTSQIR